MISYTLKIDNVLYTGIFQVGASLLVDASEDFDSGKIMLKHTTKATEYEPGTDVEINVGRFTFRYIIQADNVQQVSRLIYDHEITLVEHTAKLTKNYMVDKYYTLNSDGDLHTHNEVLTNILSLVPFGKTSLYTIATATQTALDTNMPQKKFNGSNLYQATVEIMRGIKATPRLTYQNEITHSYYDDLNNDVSGKLLGYVSILQRDKNFNNYATNYLSKAKNIVYDGDLISGGTYFPNKTSGVTPRSSTGDYSDNNAEYQFDLPIRRMIQATLKNLVLAPAGPGGGGTITATLTEYVSGGFGAISSAIVSKEEWDGLPLGSSTLTTLYTQRAQRNTLYFDGNVIPNMADTFKDSATITRDTMELVVRSWLYLNGYDPLLDYSNQNIKDYEINFFYQAIFDADISSEKWTETAIKRSEILSNQKDTIIDIGRYGGVLSDIAQRMSNGNLLLELTHYSEDDIFEVTDYVVLGGVFKIMKAKYDLFPNHVKGTYELSENYVSIDGYQTVNRGVDPYTIQRDFVDSNYKYTEYIELSGTNRTDDGSLTTQGKKTLLNILDYALADDLPVYHAQYQSTDSNQGASAINISCIGTGAEGIRFSMQFIEPKFVGGQLANDGFGDRIEPIRYTDESGFMTSATFYLINNMTIVPNDYPLSPYASTSLLTFTETFDLNPSERLGLNIELLFASDDPNNIVIGEKFSSANNLVREYFTQNLKVCVSDTQTRYTVQDKFIKEVAAEYTTGFSTNKTTFAFDVSSIAETDTKTWAVANQATDEIYFAVNGGAYDVIYFNNLKERTNTETL